MVETQADFNYSDENLHLYGGKKEKDLPIYHDTSSNYVEISTYGGMINTYYYLSRIRYYITNVSTVVGRRQSMSQIVARIFPGVRCCLWKQL